MRTTVKLPWVLILFVLLSSCDDDDIGTTSVFTIEVGPGYLSSFTDDWVIISDQDGHFLDAQQLTEGNFNLQTSQTIAGDKINVTFLNRSTPNPTVAFFSATSYMGVTIGSTWVLQTAPLFERDSEIGSFDLIINNLPDIETHNITLSKITDGRIGFEGGVTDNTANFTVAITETQKDILLCINPLYVVADNLPEFDARYYLIEDPANGAQIELDFEQDLLAFDQQFDVQLTTNINNAFIDIRAFRDITSTGNGFLMANKVSIVNLESLPVYYNDGFDGYVTDVRLSNNENSFIYHKRGTPPTIQDLAPRTEDFQVNTNGFNSYILTADPSFNMVESGWSKVLEVDGIRNLLSWTVYSATDDIRFPVLNDFGTLAGVNTVLDITNLDNTYNRCTIYLDGKDYQDFLIERFITPSSPGDGEEYYQLQKFGN